MIWTYPLVPIGELVGSVDKWEPCQSQTNELFTYIDISSINRETKQIEEFSEVLTHDAPSRARQIVKVEDVLVSTVRPNLNAVAYLDDCCDGATASTGFTVLRAKPQKLNARYLYYWVRTPYFVQDMVKRSTGASYPAISDSIVKGYGIPLPPIAQQRRIAEILDRADAIRRKRQEAIRLTEELLRSAFLEMFGDPVANPKGWEMVGLGKLLAEPLQNGAYFEKDRYVQNGTGTEMVHMSDAFYGVVKRGNLKQVCLTPAEIEKYGLNSSDILIARRSLNYEGSAKPCLIPATQDPLIFESSLIRVRLRQDIIDPIFFFSYMLQPRARETYVFPHVTKSTISGINQAGLQRVQVLVPPIAIQRSYRSFYEKTSAFTAKHEENMTSTNHLFNSLLQSAFRGEL